MHLVLIVHKVLFRSLFKYNCLRVQSLRISECLIVILGDEEEVIIVQQ